VLENIHLGQQDAEGGETESAEAVRHDMQAW
jgi:hypothetical protein